MVHFSLPNIYEILTLFLYKQKLICSHIRHSTGKITWCSLISSLSPVIGETIRASPRFVFPHFHSLVEPQYSILFHPADLCCFQITVWLWIMAIGVVMSEMTWFWKHLFPISTKWIDNCLRQPLHYKESKWVWERCFPLQILTSTLG